MGVEAAEDGARLLVETESVGVGERGFKETTEDWEGYPIRKPEYDKAVKGWEIAAWRLEE